MGERQPTNSELNLQRLEADAAREAREERGIFELFEEDDNTALLRDEEE